MVFYPCLWSCLLISVLTAKITLTQAFVILIGLPVKLRKWHLQEIERFKKWFDSYSNSGVLPSEQVALLKHKIRNVPWLVVWSLINCFTVNIEWSWRPFAPSECGWAGRGLLALHPSGPREDSRPWPGHLAASDAHTFQHLGTLGCLTIMPSQGPSWERRPIMGALKSPPCWRSLGLGGQACTYPWRYSPFPAACHSWGEAGPRSWRA